MDYRTASLKQSTGQFTERPVKKRALIAGWASLLLPLPSIMWRLAMLAGIDVGLGITDFYRSSLGNVAYVLGLELLQILAAVLCFGLIRPWSEVMPGWIPGLGGRRIPRAIPGTIGAVGVLALFSQIGAALVALLGVWLGYTDGWTPDEGMTTGERVLFLACYVPFFVWPVAAAVTVVGYWLRRRPTDRDGSA